jgi:hypothetical protein
MTPKCYKHHNGDALLSAMMNETVPMPPRNGEASEAILYKVSQE